MRLIGDKTPGQNDRYINFPMSQLAGLSSSTHLSGLSGKNKTGSNVNPEPELVLVETGERFMNTSWVRELIATLFKN